MTTNARDVPIIELDTLVHRLGGANCQVTPEVPAAVARMHDRERFLTRLLPSRIVRRLDAGFARSNPVHPDTARALYLTCRAARPECIFETGTYWGYSTAYLAAAVRDNGQGRVWSFDIYPKAGRHLPKSLRKYVELVRGAPIYGDNAGATPATRS